MRKTKNELKKLQKRAQGEGDLDLILAIQNELKAPEPTDDAIEGQEQVLAQDWLSATRAFEESEFVSKYLGAPFKEAMLAIKSCEQEEFSRTITAFEYDTYLLSS